MKSVPLILSVILVGCRGSAEPQSASPPTTTSVMASEPTSMIESSAADEDEQAYPWLADSSVSTPTPVDTIKGRFQPPEGLQRVFVEEGSFGTWLRNLPLAAEGTPVRSYKGEIIVPYDDPRLGAVVAIDVGTGDLQQCADSVIRLHAEWQWSRGERHQSYRAGRSTELPFSRWNHGERAIRRDGAIVWEPRNDHDEPDHASFRRYLDNVFMWANTGSLSLQAKQVERNNLAPGDFVIEPGSPGHTVLVLDMARSDDGQVALLLGQGFMPAQNFHVIRPGPGSAWFFVKDSDEVLRTPFWRPFSWNMLRRLDR